MWQKYTNGLNLSVLQPVFFSYWAKKKAPRIIAKDVPSFNMVKIAQS